MKYPTVFSSGTAGGDGGWVAVLLASLALWGAIVSVLVSAILWALVG